MNKTVAITGAASGIGKAATRRLASQGWDVFALDIARIAVAPNITPLVCDVADAASVTTAFDRVAARAPKLDALICCAGILRIGPIAEMPVEEFDRVFAINTRGSFLCAKAAFPLLKAAAQPDAPSRVVFLSSVAALRPKISSGAYAASKAAVSQLTRVIGVEWAEHGILVNALAPGTVDTPMIHAVSDPAKAGRYRPSGVSPVGRIATADDVVDVMLFLLSASSRYVTGTTIPVDGGTQAAFVPPQGD
jgi:NAD(P)-dependent dehydrogenase (short-subunit alcohol dehydrogenase family)